MNESSVQAQKERLLALLKRHSFEEKPVVLSSGKKSDFYIDCRKTALTAEGHFLIGWLLNELLKRDYPNIQAVGGMTMGADPLVSATCTMSFLGGAPLEGFYVRKETKKHGTEKSVECSAKLTAGSTKAVILEDVVTSGGSTLRAIQGAENNGIEIVGVIALVDRLEGGSASIMEKAPFQSLFNRHDFMRGSPSPSADSERE